MSGGTDKHILLIGCGNMGQALLNGWLAKGYSSRTIRVLDPAPKASQAARALGATLARDADLTANGGPLDVVVLAVKPDQLESVLQGYAGLAAPERVFLSIVAGKPIRLYERLLGPGAAVVRAMPNTPAAIGQGMTVLCAGKHATEPQKALCAELMAAVGDIAWVDNEEAMDAVTAVSGSGPAYVFLLIECLTDAAIELGLDESLARQLAERTVAGAGAYAVAAQESAAELRRRVTSRGGTTEAALAVLGAPDGLASLMRRAVRAAAKRSRELG